MADSMRISRGRRPILLAVTIAAAIGGFLVTRPNSTTVFVPFIVDAALDSAPVDSPPVDSPPDSPIDSPIDSPPPSVARLAVPMGQSNTGGLCVAANVGLSAAYAAVPMMEKTAGAGAANPPVFTEEGARDLGPRLVNFGGAFAVGTGGVELSMGRYLAEHTSDTWHIAKFSIDGSSLVNHWANPAYPSTGGNMLARTIAFVDAQIARWSITDAPNNLIFVWIQGEADGGAAYATYLSSMRTLFNGLRSYYGDVRIVVNRTIDVVDTAGNVRAAQEAYAAETTGCASVGRDDLTLRDTAHYSDQSYVDLGNVLGAKIVQLINGTTPTAPYYVATAPITVTNSVGTLTPTLPPHQSGDIITVFLAGSGQNNYSLSTANGFAEVSSSPQHDSSSGLNARVHAYWVRADSTTMAANGGQMPAPTIGDVAGDGSKLVTAVVIRGAVSSGSPFDVTAGNTATTATAVSIPGGTTTSTNRLVIGAVAANVDTTTPQLVDWTNADLTELAGQVNYSTNSGAGVTLGVFTGRKATASAFGATTSTLSTTSPQARITLVVK